MRVEITDEFRAKLLKYYRGNFKFVSKALRCLKTLKEPVSFMVFAVKMAKFGYDDIDRISSNITNASSSNRYEGFWNYSTSKDNWVFMPDPIKNELVD